MMPFMSDDKSNADRLQVVCVLKSGGDYKSEHVMCLKEMCLKHAPKHDFICLSDIEIAGCDTRKLKHPEWKGWWSKMELFGPTLEDKPTLFFDLDTIIVGDMTGILSIVYKKEFVILRDVYRGRSDPKAMQSSVMYWSKKPSDVYEQFVNEAHDIMSRMRGDQDFLEVALKDRVEYFQGLTLGFSSYKADVVRRGVLPKDRVIVFHGKPRPWQQMLVPYGLKPAPPPLVLRKGFVVPHSDTQCLPSVLAHRGELDSIVSLCSARRTVLQAGGNVGVWPAHLAQTFDRVITFEPDEMNFKALSINVGDLNNVRAYNAALGATSGRAGLRRIEGNIGAHSIRTGDEFDVVSLDSLGVGDCDLLQLDVEGYEHEALLGARKTIEASKPLIVLELKRLGEKYGHTDQSTIDLLHTWGYEQIAKFSRDVVFRHLSKKVKAVQFHNMPAAPPVRPDESCLLIGNGPSAVLDGKRELVDSFDQVVRFNQFKIKGFESSVGTKTTLWSTFGRNTVPQDDVKPDRAIFIHGDNGDPAWEMKELWRIPRSYFDSIMPAWKYAVGDQGNKLLPSSGFLVASWLLDQGVKKIHLLGFDHFEKHRTGQHHYWVSRSFKKPKEHDGDFESSMFKKWEAEGRVVYLR